MTEAQRNAITRYRKKNIQRITLDLNVKTDLDIIEWLKIRTENGASQSATIKEACRIAMNAPFNS